MSAADNTPPDRPWRRPTLEDRVAEAHHRADPYACTRCGGPAKVTIRPGHPGPVVAVQHRPDCPTRRATR